MAVATQQASLMAAGMGSECLALQGSGLHASPPLHQSGPQSSSSWELVRNASF